jgi:predicted Zn-dependent protease
MDRLVLALVLAVGALSPVVGAQGPVGSRPADESLRSIRQKIDTGHPDEALAAIAKLRAAGALQPGLNRLEGLADYANSDLRGADAAFAAALKEDPKDQESGEMRGLVLVRLGRPADAIPLLESAKNGPLTKADPNYILALCYMDVRRYDDARRAFAAQYSVAPDGAAAYLLAARMLLRREYLPVAQQFAEKSLALEPLLPLAHELLGEIALAGGHLDVAIEELEQEKARNPLEGNVYDRLGDAYLRSARYEDAQRVLQQAILLEPNATGPFILLGKTMLKRNDAVGAATYLQRADQLDPSNYMTHSLLGQAYRAMGRAEDASRETATAQRLQSASEPKLDGVK